MQTLTQMKFNIASHLFQILKMALPDNSVYLFSVYQNFRIDTFKYYYRQYISWLISTSILPRKLLIGNSSTRNSKKKVASATLKLHNASLNYFVSVISEECPLSKLKMSKYYLLSIYSGKI